jgi:hypothetical protein
VAGNLFSTSSSASSPSDHHALRALLLDPNRQTPPRRVPDATARPFKIRAADSHGRRSSANILLNKMYAWRGYVSNPLPEQQSLNRFTLVANDHDQTMGTMTVGFDSAADGLLADDLFRDELSALRAQGRRICEFTKLAIDPSECSKRVLASLFHVAYIYAHRIKGFDCLVIEVNPRHVRYYQRMLGFELMASERPNRRVNAPAVLLRLDFTHAHEQIDIYGGKPELASVERSLYPLAFSMAEEDGIVARLRRPHWDIDPPLTWS